MGRSYIFSPPSAFVACSGTGLALVYIPGTLFQSPRFPPKCCVEKSKFRRLYTILSTLTTKNMGSRVRNEQYEFISFLDGSDEERRSVGPTS
jgi:hypothetical protein